MTKPVIRKAGIEDVGQIQVLINRFARQQLMLPRSLSGLYDNLRDFWVCQQNNRISGCCALHITWQGLAELRSLAVSGRFQRKGIGRQLINAALLEARQLGCSSVFTLSYIPDYFRRLGFRTIGKEKLPHKIWADCINCPKFPDCKEIALIKKL